MPREKKYTKTIAVRVTPEEWELVQYAVRTSTHANPSAFLRFELENAFKIMRVAKAQAEKRAEARARREAKKAANVNA